MNTRLPVTRTPGRMVTIAGSLGMALSISLTANVDLQAAPQAPPIFEAKAQNVDYIPAETAPALDLGFPVLVPSWVPSPFGGQPAIDAGGGYYGLYWMIAGGEPTFLHVTGQAGGGLPAGSPYDLNNELFINASVMGYDAIHDVTPAYDAVWWIAGGVLYKVESRNSGTDSLSLANSLIAFVGPSVSEPEPTVIPDPTIPPDPGPTSPPEVEESQVEVPVDSVPTTAPTDEAVEPDAVESGTEVEPEAVEPDAVEPSAQVVGEGTEEAAAPATEAEVGESGEISVSPSDNSLTSDGTGQS
ncbi:MAG TPA: hypothetical protein VEW66_04385, partial [Thermomicrobiales bacterium]|nr:hypothetical protein [Thermomicrobiales bacterium]